MDLQTLNGVKKALAYVEKFKKKNKNRDRFLYSNVNKSYKKLNWAKEKFNNAEAKEVFENTALPVQRKMREYGWLKYYPNNNINDGYYLKSNVENLFLLQELMCQMDDDYWISVYKPVYKKAPMKPFHFDSAYRGDVYLFSYPLTKEWKAELLTKFLKTKEFLFDEDSPYWKGMKKLRYFCLKNLMNSKVERWEWQVQRFLTKND